ncbi:hypothetical protein ES288_A11G007400v1 [Gossypium darwinii]|uniref:TCP domain-containing protein n=1 Tax=Gossypium darwinii TaxID=34276 RepID=A0A5D2EG83_GOSDA|nr:hypothetical protein ES288_A11G007400v1 [Gossypium darwinii]
MFPSNSNGNNNDPITYFDNSILPLSFFHFPSSPYYNQCELLQLVDDYDVLWNQQQQQRFDDDDDDQFLHQTTLLTDNSVSETIVNLPDCRHNNTTTDIHQQPMPRKRPAASKTDRHSKINTANGPRDRRMRLSLDVAREFFGLQDMLGYDKASRTVEWLLIQAKPEINKLMNNNNNSFGFAKSPSSTSETEVVSGIDKAAAIDGNIPKVTHSKKEKKERRQRKTSFRPLARDMRVKARERAKARTKEKNMSLRLNNETRDNDPNRFGSSWSSTWTKQPGIQHHHNNNNTVLQANNININGDRMIWSLNCLQNTGLINQELTGSVLW